MNLFYLKQGKDELILALEMFKDLNDSALKRMLKHLIKGMNFMIDFLNNKHVEMDFEMFEARKLVDKVVGKEFMETYYYLNTLSSKNFNILNSEHIIIQGKSVDYVDKKFFKELINKVADYFNTIYDMTESGKVWH